MRYGPSSIEQAYRAGKAAGDDDAARAPLPAGHRPARASARATPDQPDALLWLAANLAGEALTHGKLRALRVIPEIEATLLRLEQSRARLRSRGGGPGAGEPVLEGARRRSPSARPRKRRYFELALARAPDFPGNQAHGGRVLRPTRDCARARAAGRGRGRACAISTPSVRTRPSGGSSPARCCATAGEADEARHPVRRRGGDAGAGGPAGDAGARARSRALRGPLRLRPLRRAGVPRTRPSSATRSSPCPRPCRRARRARAAPLRPAHAGRATCARSGRCFRRCGPAWWSAICGCRWRSRRLSAGSLCGPHQRLLEPVRRARRASRCPNTRS